MPTVSMKKDGIDTDFLINSKREVVCRIDHIDGTTWVTFFPYQGTDDEMSSSVYTRFLQDKASWYAPKSYRDMIVGGMLSRGVTREDISSKFVVILNLRYVPERLRLDKTAGMVYNASIGRYLEKEEQHD